MSFQQSAFQQNAFQIQVEGSTPAIASDQDGWWAGAAKCFVGVAIAGAALALSTSVAIAGGFKHQDEFVRASPSESDSGSTNWRKVERTVHQRWGATDEFPSLTPVLDDGAWSPPTLIVASIQSKVWAEHDNIERIAEEADGWSAKWTPAKTQLLAVWDSADFAVQAATVSEDDFRFDLQKALATVVAVFGGADDDFVAQATFAAEDDFWLVQPRAPVPVVAVLGDDEILPVPVPAGSDGNSFGQRRKYQTTVLRWAQGEDFSPAANAIAHEDAWQTSLVVAPATAHGRVWTDDDFAAPAQLVDEEDHWASFKLPQPAPLILVWTDQDETQQIRVEEETWQAQVAIAAPVHVRVWIDDDEVAILVQQVTDEDRWQAPVPKLELPIRSLWLEQDEAPTPPQLAVDDTPWLQFFTIREKLQVTLYTEPEERPTPVPGDAPGAVGSGQRAQARTVFRNWPHTDEFVQPATQIEVLDEYWRAPDPPAVAATVRLWEEDGFVAAPPLTIEEEHWQVPISLAPLVSSANGKLWTDQDEFARRSEELPPPAGPGNGGYKRLPEPRKFVLYPAQRKPKQEQVPYEKTAVVRAIGATPTTFVEPKTQNALGALQRIIRGPAWVAPVPETVELTIAAPEVMLTLLVRLDALTLELGIAEEEMRALQAAEQDRQDEDDAIALFLLDD